MQAEWEQWDGRPKNGRTRRLWSKAVPMEVAVERDQCRHAVVNLLSLSLIPHTPDDDDGIGVRRRTSSLIMNEPMRYEMRVAAVCLCNIQM